MGGELTTNRQIEKLRESDKTHKDIYRQEDNERKKIRRKRRLITCLIYNQTLLAWLTTLRVCFLKKRVRQNANTHVFENVLLKLLLLQLNCPFCSIHTLQKPIAHGNFCRPFLDILGTVDIIGVNSRFFSVHLTTFSKKRENMLEWIILSSPKLCERLLTIEIFQTFSFCPTS